jgi:hypothetical protein
MPTFGDIHRPHLRARSTLAVFHGSQGPRFCAPKLVALIAAITIAPQELFLWLGTRLLQQDRPLEQQQARDRQQTAADLIVARPSRSSLPSRPRRAILSW